MGRNEQMGGNHENRMDERQRQTKMNAQIMEKATRARPKRRNIKPYQHSKKAVS